MSELAGVSEMRCQRSNDPPRRDVGEVQEGEWLGLPLL